MVRCVDEILGLPVPNSLPSSIVGCTALPLALHCCTTSNSQKCQDGTPADARSLLQQHPSAKRPLHTLLRAMELCHPMYDGVHWISQTIQYLMECTHFDDRILGNTRSSLNGKDAVSSDGSLSPILDQPAYYLRMALTIDISIREGRLPDEQDFPEGTRGLISRTGCFLPLLFGNEGGKLTEEDSYRYLEGFERTTSSRSPSANPRDSRLDWFVEQDRSLFFALEMGLGP